MMVGDNTNWGPGTNMTPAKFPADFSSPGFYNVIIKSSGDGKSQGYVVREFPAPFTDPSSMMVGDNTNRAPGANMTPTKFPADFSSPGFYNVIIKSDGDGKSHGYVIREFPAPFTDPSSIIIGGNTNWVSSGSMTPAKFPADFSSPGFYNVIIKSSGDGKRQEYKI